MRRREFITLLGSSAVAWPLAAHAQPTAMPVMGYLYGGATLPEEEPLAAFHQGLSERGFIEGRNLAIVFRGTDRFDRLPALAAELARLPLSLIVATGAVNAAIAAKTATTTIPIAVATGADLVQLRLVEAMNRPGGNVTGVTYMTGILLGKRLEMLRELLPNAT